MLAALVLSSALADPLPVVALEKAAKVSRVKVGVGALGVAGGSFMTQPEDRALDGASEPLPYSAMAGFSPGYGASLDVRAFGVVGLEVDVIRSTDTALSHYLVNDQEVPFQVIQPAWHVPLLLKLHAPSPVIRPNLQLGAQLVLPIATNVEVEGNLPFALSAEAEPYLLWVAGVGAEVKLPIAGADIRLPISFRAGFNTPFNERAIDRALYGLDDEGYVTSMEMRSEWEVHGAVTAGLTWYWPR